MNGPPIPLPIRLRLRLLRHLPASVVRPTRRLLEALRRAAMIPDYLRMRSSVTRRRPAVELAVGAIFRDEAPYLAEWVTFHRLMGVQRFYLYDHGSVDDWRAALAPELEAGIVTVVSWKKSRRRAQSSAYVDCLKRHRTDTRWIAFIDVDEFLFAPDGRRVPEVLEEFAGWPGVLVAWRTYGTGGWVRKPDGLVTASYLLRARDDLFQGVSTKRIVDPLLTVKRVVVPHLMMHYTKRFWRYTETRCEDGRAVPRGPGASIPAERLRINHYRSKSEEEARQRDARGRLGAIVPRSGALAPAYNAVRDELILQFQPALDAALRERPATTVDDYGPQPARVPAESHD